MVWWKKKLINDIIIKTIFKKDQKVKWRINITINFAYEKKIKRSGIDLWYYFFEERELEIEGKCDRVKIGD